MLLHLPGLAANRPPRPPQLAAGAMTSSLATACRIFASLTALGILAHGPHAQTHNLLRNAGFEAGGSDLPEGWERLIGDFTVSCLSDKAYQLTASYGAQAYHMRWFEQHLPRSGVLVRNVSKERIGFQIAGPRAQELLEELRA